MKILIASDNHGHLMTLKKAIEMEEPIDLFIHCGDLGVELSKIDELIDCPKHMVAGNNDFFSMLPREDVFSIGRYPVLLTHGHQYGVSISLDRLYYHCKENGISIAMFGHTHFPHIEYTDGVWLINPGSIVQPRQNDGKYTYIIMELDDMGKIDFKLKHI